MSAEKLENVEVPKKFSEWLLAMGCPPEKVPSLDKITEMCRGQYYMVWQSLMEHVAPKDVIANKRLQVFVDDVLQCQKKKFQEKSSNRQMPLELSLWHRQADLKKKVADAEAKLLDEKEKLVQLREKVNAKLCQRHLAKQKLSDAQRRAGLLQLLEAQLRQKKADLVEARAIGDSLCCLDDDDSDVTSKLDKCISLMSRQSTNRATSAVANPVNISIVSNNSEDNDAADEITSLLKCGGEAVFAQLYERRAGLGSRIEALFPPSQDKQRTPQSVLAETAGLHCILALEDVKNQNYTKRTMSRVEAVLDELSNTLTDTEACELLVVNCEKIKAEARIKTIRELTEDLNKRQGIFYMEPFKEGENLMKQINLAHKSIVSKRDELLKIIKTTLTIEQKALNAKDCLIYLFNSFHQKTTEITCFGPTSSPKETISTMRQFYEEKREKAKNKVDLSMDLDVSDGSFSDIENGDPKFIDELKFYLKNFNLEKNRKLVLKSGEKIWISETVQSYLNSFYHKLLSENLSITVLSPAISLSKNLELLSREMQAKNYLEFIVKGVQDGRKKSWSFDIKTQTEEEKLILDKIKKRLNEDIVTLQRTEKNLDVVNDNLKYWLENNARKFISTNRMIDGKTYKEIELNYREGFMI